MDESIKTINAVYMDIRSLTTDLKTEKNYGYDMKSRYERSMNEKRELEIQYSELEKKNEKLEIEVKTLTEIGKLTGRE